MVVHKKKGGEEVAEKWGEGRGERGGRATTQGGRGGPLCGSLTDNGLIRPNVA